MANVADYNVANASGASVRSDINNILQAVVTLNSGTSEPSTMYPFMIWVDTTNNVVKMRNGANDAWLTMPFAMNASDTAPAGLTVSGGDLTVDTSTFKVDITNDLVAVGTSSPSSYNSNTRNFVIRDSGNGGMTISTGASSSGFIAFNNGEDTTLEGLIQYNHSTNALSFRTNSVDDRLVIDSSGNLKNTAGTDLYHDLFADSGTDQGSASLRFYTDGSSDNQNVATILMQQESGGGSQQKGEMYFQVSDNSAPATALQILNNKAIYGRSGIYSYYDGSNHVAIRGLSGGNYIQYGSGTALSFVAIDTFPNSGSSTKMTLDTSGNLLVGTTDSETYSNVNGVVSAAGGYLIARRSSGVSLIQNRYNSEGYITYYKYSGTTVGSVSVSDGATAFNTSSDGRLKDVTGEAKGLEVINKLNPVSFNWKSSGKSAQGMIAQEVLEVMPECVIKDGENDYYQMDYSKLVTPLVKAVQEQQEQIEKLKQEINEIRGN